MRALALPLSIGLSLCALPAFSQAPRFIKVDVVEKSGRMMHHHKADGPSEVHVRVPLSLAKGVLESFADQEIHLNGNISEGGKSKKVDRTQKFKVDQLVKLLESTKPGDLLLDVNTSDGDQVRITVE